MGQAKLDEMGLCDEDKEIIREIMSGSIASSQRVKVGDDGLETFSVCDDADDGSQMLTRCSAMTTAPDGDELSPHPLLERIMSRDSMISDYNSYDSVE